MTHDWHGVMPLVEAMLKVAGRTVKSLREALKGLPPAMPGYGHVYYNPDTGHAWVSMGDSDERPICDAWRKAVGRVAGVREVTVEAETPPQGYHDGSENWILVKKAYSPTFRFLGQLGGWVPGPANAWYGGPSPLAASLASGLLGAGVGYGAGLVGEGLLPEEHFRPGHLRKVLALLGGGLGAAPGLWWGSVAQRTHPETPGVRAWLSGWPVRPQDMKGDSPAPPVGEPSPQYSNTSTRVLDPTDWRAASPVKVACEAAGAFLPEAEAHYKQAIGEVGQDYGVGGLMNIPVIPADQFAHAVWSDQQTPVPIRAATTGLVESASAVRGGVTMVSPADVGRIAVGMGSGYLSGMFVGKALGALAGLRPASQKKLQQAGVWAGLLTNVVPLAFGQ